MLEVPLQAAGKAPADTSWCWLRDWGVCKMIKVDEESKVWITSSVHPASVCFSVVKIAGLNLLWVHLSLQDLSLCSLFKDAARYCLRPNTLIYQKCRGRARAWASAFSPQGGESGGGIGMRLARQPQRADFQISLPVGLWEGGHIITSPGMSWGLMRWMTGGWITSKRRFQLPFLFRWWWLSWQYFQAAVKNSNSVRCLCVHPSWGSCISTQ